MPEHLDFSLSENNQEKDEEPLVQDVSNTVVGDPPGACSSSANSQISETAEAAVVNRIVVNTSCQTTPKTDKYPDVTKTQEGFRHTKADRQRILNGSRKKPKTVNETESGPNVRHSPIVGSSQSPLRIKAATNTSFDQPASTCLVYVGHLSDDTSEDGIRAHLADMGIPNDNIADVIKLRCRNSGESSFCISLDNKKYEQKVYDPSKWPIDVRIRPFKEKNSKRPSRRHRQRFVPPRFHRQRKNETSNNYYTSLDGRVSQQEKDNWYQQSAVYLSPHRAQGHWCDHADVYQRDHGNGHFRQDSHSYQVRRDYQDDRRSRDDRDMYYHEYTYY